MVKWESEVGEQIHFLSWVHGFAVRRQLESIFRLSEANVTKCRAVNWIQYSGYFASALHGRGRPSMQAWRGSIAVSQRRVGLKGAQTRTAFARRAHRAGVRPCRRLVARRARRARAAARGRPRKRRARRARRRACGRALCGRRGRQIAPGGRGRAS